ncbi:MAG: thiamine pyrophosphate-dependent enzyme [Terracidiphilus sp.]
MTTRFHSKPHPHAALPAEGSASLISNETLIEIYTAMLKCRMLSERIATLAGAGKKRAFASISEAVAAATLADARLDDSLISAAPHRCAALLKGVPLAILLQPCSQRSSSANLRSQAGHVHIASGVLSGPFAGTAFCNLAAAALAAGCAFAARHSKCENVAIAFYESANAEDSWRDVFHFAFEHKLPVILIRQSARLLRPVIVRGRSAKRVPRSLPIIPVDANDAVAIYRVAHEAITHARRGSGPTLIDCVPLRLAGERQQDSDCIVRMERYLQAKGLRTDQIGAGVAQKFTRALDAAVNAARRNARKNRKTRRSGMVS